MREHLLPHGDLILTKCQDQLKPIVHAHLLLMYHKATRVSPETSQGDRTGEGFGPIQLDDALNVRLPIGGVNQGEVVVLVDGGDAMHLIQTGRQFQGTFTKVQLDLLLIPLEGQCKGAPAKSAVFEAICSS